jgi:hypothetical protein
MGRAPRIPAEFKRRPFSLEEARQAGLSRHSLRGKAWRRIACGLYRWSELPDDEWLTLSAWRRVLPGEAVFAGASAAWLHGVGLGATDPAEVLVPPSSGIRTRAGLLVHHGEISPSEVVSIRGLGATALPLTLARLCLQLPPAEALVAIDTALYRGLTDPAALIGYAQAAKGRPGATTMLALAMVAAPAESPMETRLRWLLIDGGLPRPEVQTRLHDASARFVGRVDLYYPEARLALEYDGGNHRERMVEDNRRQNALVNAGYQLLRFTAADIYDRADVVVAQVRAALGSALRKRRL